LTDDERKSIREKGVRIDRRIVALDSIAVIVNPECPVEEITISDLAKTFSGEIDDWSKISQGFDGKPIVFVREAKTGTSRYFREHVFSDLSHEAETSSEDPYLDSAKVVTSHQAMISGVSAEKGSIGYVGLGFALQNKDKVKVLKLKLLADSPPVIPTLTAETTNYPFSRPLYLFTDKNPKENAARFVEFCTSEKGKSSGGKGRRGRSLGIV